MTSTDSETEDHKQEGNLFSKRVILTTYPGQSNVKPIPIQWGAEDPLERGPIIVSRQASTISTRNAIGAHGGKQASRMLKDE